MSTMQTFDTPDAMRTWSDSQRASGRRIALVPTMGALHDGHMALVSEARRRADAVVISIFVNPLQFNRPDDFAAYPRPIDDDLAICAAQRIDAVYAPTAAAMYPADFETHVTPGAIAERLEGAHRPGHFRGVTTVVAKLFGAVRPHVALFGQKDYQQFSVIRRMAIDLDMGIEVAALPTVRDIDGLAMSSRNRRLTPVQRAAAVCVPRALQAVADALAAGEHEVAALAATGRKVVDAEPLAAFEHLEIVHRETLEAMARVDGEAVAVMAAWFGDVRLIDNRLL